MNVLTFDNLTFWIHVFSLLASDTRHPPYSNRPPRPLEPMEETERVRLKRLRVPRSEYTVSQVPGQRQPAHPRSNRPPFPPSPRPLEPFVLEAVSLSTTTLCPISPGDPPALASLLVGGET